MNIDFAPSFVRSYKKLSKDLQQDVKEKIELFRQDPKHPFLKTHKLKGRLEGRLSFSINYAYRIIFKYRAENEAILLAVGDHDVYKK